MIQRLAFAGLGILFLASPSLASAATLSDLQAQLQSLLSTLLQLQSESGRATSQTFTASPISGTAPSSVVFRERTIANADSLAIDFGDGTGFGTMVCDPSTGSNDSVCRVTHAYTMPGVYLAELIGKGLGNDSQWQGTGKRALVIVYKPKAGSAFATIDQKSLTTTSVNPTISGTVVHADIQIWIKKGRVAVESSMDTRAQDDLWRNPEVLAVAGGYWSAQVAGGKLENGIYTVVVSDKKTSLVLATGTLFIDASK